MWSIYSPVDGLNIATGRSLLHSWITCSARALVYTYVLGHFPSSLLKTMEELKRYIYLSWILNCKDLVLYNNLKNSQLTGCVFVVIRWCMILGTVSFFAHIVWDGWSNWKVIYLLYIFLSVSATCLAMKHFWFSNNRSKHIKLIFQQIDCYM